MSPVFRITTLCILVPIACAGCSVWSRPESKSVRLPVPMLPPDSVVLETCSVRVPLADYESLWDEVDEQHLPIELRRHLADNGFRCGLVGSSLPVVLRKLLSEDKSQLLDEMGSDVDIDGGTTPKYQRMRLRAGRRGEILASSVRENIHVLFVEEDRRVRGQPYRQAQCLLGVRAFPQGDGQVRVQLTPEIHHGAPRRRYTAGAAGLQFETRRDREVFERLRLEAVLSPGQTLLLTSTVDSKGLGDQFFSASAGGGGSRKLRLVRLAQTQYDDLFASEDAALPARAPSP